MTSSDVSALSKIIIPYQELLGNYDMPSEEFEKFWIIPYQELLGNYD